MRNPLIARGALSALLLVPGMIAAQEPGGGAPVGYEFSTEISLPATPVKDQHRSGTCWSYATTSFMESELLRTGKGTFDLSEMFFVRKAYELKARKYVRMHGTVNFGPGGLAMDVLHIWERYGVLPETAYGGLTAGDSLPVHGEMDGVLKGYIDQVIRNPDRKLSPVWEEGFHGILDAYLGPVPERFSSGEHTFDAATFAGSLGLDPDEYVAVGSYTHHPFYSEFILEIPDNWIWGSVYNVPLEEMMQLLDHALENGYTLCWDADVGEKGFDWKRGVALLPAGHHGEVSGLERARWDELPEDEKQKRLYDFSSPKREVHITQLKRQRGFDDYSTTDDHLMHITGTARDQFGNRWYAVKNSWGSEGHIEEGYLYASVAYMKAKTIFLMVHRHALPADLSDKLGIR